MQKTVSRPYTHALTHGGPAGGRKGGPRDCRLQKRAVRRDKRLKLTKIIVFKTTVIVAHRDDRIVDFYYPILSCF